MKKYKLIKTYPGSPKLGFTVTFTSEDRRVTIFGDSGAQTLYKYIIKNSPEFWEEIDDKEFEILSFLNKDNNLLYFQDTNKTFSTKNSKGKFMTCGSRSFDYCKSYYKINSVKRNLDGQVFSIGDRVRISKLQHDGSFTIEKFYLSVNEETLLCNGDGGNGHVSIEKIEHSTPLFTTEDGVDIFIGSNYWVYDPTMQEDYRVHKVTNASQTHDGKGLNRTYFSTREKAEEYILYNKPVLSLKEVLTALNLHWVQEVNLEKLVKEKI